MSDARVTLPLPEASALRARAANLEAALATGAATPVRQAGAELLRYLSAFYGVPSPSLQVLGVRPHKVYGERLSYELFGDYTLETQRIRVWMRTAILEKVTSYRGLLNTLLHEFCHHLDIKGLKFTRTPHTRGFYARVDELYHLALATPVERRRPLAWIKTGAVWRIDWAKLRAPAVRGPSPSRPRAPAPRPRP